MKHRALVTPLNANFSAGIANFLRMEQSEYDAIMDRAVYCKSPDISWFKMKSSATTPYLEPTFYGLKAGDIVEVEFWALAISGINPYFSVPFLQINGDYSSTSKATINTSILSSHFKKYNVKYVLPADFNGIGLLINLRAGGTNNEIIVKDIEITIDTSNPLFSISENIVTYRTKTDYMQCIDFYSGTNLNTAYNSLLNVYNAGAATFPDDETLQFVNAGTTNFKGLMAMLNGHKYRPAFAIYVEYISAIQITLTSKSVKEDGTFTEDGSFKLPTSNTIRKAMVYFLGGTAVARKTFLDLGMVTSGGDFTVKNVRFSMPLFDDTVKRQPNQLEELYTNLRAKLR